MKAKFYCQTCGVIDIEPFFMNSGEGYSYVPILVIPKKEEAVSYIMGQMGYPDNMKEDINLKIRNVKLNHSDDEVSSNAKGHDIGEYACWCDEV